MALTASASRYFDVQTVNRLPAPWSLALLPGGGMLVSERPPTSNVANPTAPGAIRFVSAQNTVSAPLAGLPSNVGVLDIKLAPDFAQSRVIYFSFMERDPSAPRIGRNVDDRNVDPAGIVVAKATLDLTDPNAPRLSDTAIFWKGTKVVSHAGSGEPGGKLAFSPDGKHLFIASGDRQEFAPVQSLENSLGKIIRLNADGSVPTDNPFAGTAGALPEIWSLGLRNPYGLVFDRDGVLWEHEMGPAGGDELNVVARGANYGWPNVSYGNHYTEGKIPKPAAGDGFTGSPLFWTPVIAPSGMIAYSGEAFPQFRGDLIVSGLQSRGLVVVDTVGTSATEIARIDLGARTRGIEQAADGSLWAILDQPDGRLLHLKPASILPSDRAGDFDGDGRDDVLWRDSRGAIASWSGERDGGFGGTMTLASAPGDWSIAATGDFDGDGRSDLLWRSEAGTVSDWLSTGQGFRVNDAIAMVDVEAAWQIAGTADFNGDGRDDILWRSAGGAVSTWLGRSDGGFVNNDAKATSSTPGGWWVNGVGDLNGDGRADIVWRNDDGALSNWLGNADGGFAVNDAVGFNQVVTDWRMIGVGDFNGDGFDDLLWRNKDGTLSNWLADARGGYTPNDANALVRISLDWQVVGTGDYDGDAYDDVLWRNVNGDTSDWLGSASGALRPNDGTAYAAMSTSWTVATAGGLLF